MAAFDHWVSLGNNCEGAFQMRRVLERDDASFFSWNITTFDAFLSLMQADFAGIMQVENLRYHDGELVHDLSHKFWFHSDFPKDPNINYRDYPDILAKHQSKARHLIDKFHRVITSDDKTCYFYKTEEFEIRPKVIQMRDALLKASGGRDNFHLVIVQAEDRREPEWGDHHISNRYMRRVSPFNDATDGHVQSWDRVFLEFACKRDMHLANFE